MTLVCPGCQSRKIKRNGRDDTEPSRQRYACLACFCRFDDLSGTVLAGRHQKLRIWVLCLYFMGLNLSNRQIAAELDLNESDAQAMTTCLREGLVARAPAVQLCVTVEIDEVYVVAGHKGNPSAIAKKNRKPRRRRLRGAPGRGTLAAEKPPILGMIGRCGQIAVHMLDNVKQATIRPIITAGIAQGSLIYTEEYDIYARLTAWGYDHATVNHDACEYARDADGDGFHEIHVNTAEGVWSLLRSWLRPHRGISQERLPPYLGFFQFVHNARKRGKRLLAALIETLLRPAPRNAI